MLSEVFGGFGDFENFVNLIGEDCGEVGLWVPGHVGAEGGFSQILGILNVPNLWHAAPGSERESERKTKLSEIRKNIFMNNNVKVTVPNTCQSKKQQRRNVFFSPEFHKILE